MMSAPLVSVVVPVLGDAGPAARLLAQLHAYAAVEVIVIDGGQDPELDRLADSPRTRVMRSAPGRGRQMNAGAAVATGEWLLFLHADSILPDGWLDACRLLAEANAGWFQFALDDDAWQARVLEQLVAWRVKILTLPYGDQGLFVRRDVFVRLGGYRDMPLLEDVELVRRLVASGPVVSLPFPLRTSSRRWRHDGWWWRSARNVAIIVLYAWGVSPAVLVRWYRGGHG